MGPVRDRKDLLGRLPRAFFVWTISAALISWSHVSLIGKIGLVLLVGFGYFLARKYGGMKGFLAEFREGQGKAG